MLENGFKSLKYWQLFFWQKEPSPEPVQQDAPKAPSWKSQRKESAAVEKKEEEAAPAEGFKLKKKSSVTPRKPIQKEEEQPAFAGMKLKKAQTVKRTWDDGGLEKVDLKHHEFEGEPQEEQVT